MFLSEITSSDSPFPHIDASAADYFWKQSDKRRNCSLWGISPFATMFSTVSNKFSIIYWFSICLPRSFQNHRYLYVWMCWIPSKWTVEAPSPMLRLLQCPFTCSQHKLTESSNKPVQVICEQRRHWSEYVVMHCLLSIQNLFCIGEVKSSNSKP